MTDLLVGVLLDDGKEFVVDITGVTATPAVPSKFAIGSRVRVTNADKSYPKFDDLAKTLNLSKFAIGRKAVAKTMGIVVGSCVHPVDSSITVIAVRGEDGAEFLFDSLGIELAPASSNAWPIGARITVSNSDKVQRDFCFHFNIPLVVLSCMKFG